MPIAHTSNVPAQALSLLNDPFVLEQCELWAEHTLANHADGAQRIDWLYRTAFGRPPTAEELAAANEFIIQQSQSYGASADDRQAWKDLCHVLVNLQEFIYLK